MCESQCFGDFCLGPAFPKHSPGFLQAAGVYVLVERLTCFLFEQAVKVELAVAGQACGFREGDIAACGFGNMPANSFNDLCLEIGLCMRCDFSKTLFNDFHHHGGKRRHEFGTDEDGW